MRKPEIIRLAPCSPSASRSSSATRSRWRRTNHSARRGRYSRCHCGGRWKNLIARLNLTSCHEKAAVSFVQQPGIRVAAVVHVAIWSTPKDDLPVGIRTVLDSFAKFLPNRRLRRYLSNNVDTPDPLACVKRARCEHTQAFDTGRLQVDVSHCACPTLIRPNTRDKLRASNTLNARQLHF